MRFVVKTEIEGGRVWGLVGLRDLLGFKMRWKRVAARWKGNIFRGEMKR
jgi:hypothetical protein